MRRLGALTVAAWLALALLALAVLRQATLPADRALLLAVHARDTSSLDRAALTLTLLGGLGGMTPLACVLGWLSARRAGAGRVWWPPALLAGAYGLSVLLKVVLARPRPQLWPALTPALDASFPSGHALLSLTALLIALPLAWPTRGRWIVLGLGLAFVLLVGWARLDLGVHYPSDVLGGWLAALAWTGSGVWLLRRSGRAPSDRL